MRFSDLQVKNLKPENKKKYLREQNGFAIRVMPSGVKTWLYIFTFEGKRRELNLGEYPLVSLEKARDKFNEARKLVIAGTDPIAALASERIERKRTPTLESFVDEFIKVYARPNLKSWEKIERSLKREIVPVLGMMKITDIKRRDVLAILNPIAARVPVMANRLAAYTGKLFSWAVEQDVLEINPLAGMKRPGGKEKPAERCLTPAEIKTLWAALDAPDLNMTDEMRRAVKLVLVTAQRPGEVIGMHSIELDGAWWTIPGTRTKNGLTHRVYLTPTALSLIGDTSGKGYIFKTAGEVDRPMTENAVNVAVRRHLFWPVRDAKGNELYSKDGKVATENRLGIDHFTPHDLRRTAITLMAQEKIIKEYRERVVNHKLAKIDGTYNVHDYDDEKQMALEALERRLLGITGETTTGGKVISIQTRKAA